MLYMSLTISMWSSSLMRSRMTYAGYKYNMEKDIDKRKVLICIHYLLLSNDEDIFDKDYKTRLDNALAMN